VPVGPEGSLGWQGITYLRKSLQQQGRLAEAFSLLRPETNLIQSNRAKLRPWQDFVAASRASAPIQPLWLLESKARLSLADLWIELGDPEKAEQEIDQADALFQSGLTEIPAEHNSNVHLDVEYARMKLNLNDTSMLVVWEDFAERAIKREHHYPVGIESLDLAADLAHTLLKQEGTNADAANTFHRLQAHLDTLDVKSGDALARVQHQHRVALDACASGTELETTTKWYQDFAKKHPECQLWSLIQHFMLVEIKYYRTAGDWQSQHTSILRFKNFLDDHARFWEEPSPSPSGVLDQEAMVAPGVFWMAFDTGTDSPCDEADLQFPPEMQDDLNMNVGWTGEILNSEYSRLRGRPASTLFRWMQQGISEGHLTSADLEHVLGCRPSDGTYRMLLDTQSDSIIEDADVNQTMDRIFFRENKLVSVAQWETTFSILRRWLLRAPYIERQRNHAIGLLQRFRIASVIEFARTGDDIEETLRIETERFQELYATLPEDAQGGLAEAHHGLLGLSSVLKSSGGEPDQLHQALGVQMQLLEYSRQNRQLSVQAQIHAVMAMTYWSKISSNLVHADGMHANGIWNATTQTFEHLNAAEELYDELRRDILRRGGLDAVEEALLFSDQFHIGQAYVGNSMVGGVYGLAIQVSEQTSMVGPRAWGKMWEWIQRAKGCTMSEYMGVGPVIPGRPEDPRSLSEPAQELLQEEERLVDKLLRTPLSDRSLVRQALSAVRENQKKLPELQNTADYPGCNPILLEDLAWISQLAGGDVVFVDWYFDGHKFSMVTVSEGVPKPHKLDGSLLQNLSEVFGRLFSPRFHPRTLLDTPQAHSTLLKLNAFVAPIAQVSKPGDLIVLCPSSRLHLIPLHALEVGGVIYPPKSNSLLP
jgi:tetratricopeptide (TPR) repeat protein